MRSSAANQSDCYVPDDGAAGYHDYLTSMEAAFESKKAASMEQILHVLLQAYCVPLEAYRAHEIFADQRLLSPDDSSLAVEEIGTIEYDSDDLQGFSSGLSTGFAKILV